MAKKHGYLTFLKNLSEHQQRYDIGILAFRERWPEYLSEVPLVDDVMLQYPLVVAYSQKLGVAPFNWESGIEHDLQWAEPFGSPVFHDDQCLVPFSFRYQYLAQNLVVHGTTYVNDLGNTVMGIRGCDIETAPSLESPACERLIALGIDPETRGPVTYINYDPELFPNISYLDFLRDLLPGQQQYAVDRLIDPNAWLDCWRQSPTYLKHPKLAAELEKRQISNLVAYDGMRVNIGPAEFSPGRCTVTFAFFLQQNRKDYDDPAHFAEVHLLCRIEDRPSLAKGAEIVVEDGWLRTQCNKGVEQDPTPVIIDDL